MKLKPLLLTGFIGAALCVASFTAHAQSIYTAGHGDLGVEYTPGDTHFEAHWHMDAGSTINGQALSEGEEYAPDELVARLFGTSNVSNSTIATSLGVSTGYTAYRTGITAYPPNLGFALEEVGSPGDWLDSNITLTLTGFSGPGELAISQSISGLGTFVWFSSLGDDFTIADNSWEFGVGGHQHLDWWFTEAGIYEIDFTWTGTYIGMMDPIEVSGSGTFGFQVGVVPEPGTWGLIVAGLLGGLVTLRRRQRASMGSPVPH